MTSLIFPLTVVICNNKQTFSVGSRLKANSKAITKNRTVQTGALGGMIITFHFSKQCNILHS